MEIEWPRCQKCSDGVLIPLSDYGRDGASIMYKAWVCTNPSCGFNLRIDNGIEVQLPEQGVAAAWRRLADYDRRHRLLARKITVVDLRLPGRLVVRRAPDAAPAGRDAKGKST